MSFQLLIVSNVSHFLLPFFTSPFNLNTSREPLKKSNERDAVQGCSREFGQHAARRRNGQRVHTLTRPARDAQLMQMTRHITKIGEECASTRHRNAPAQLLIQRFLW